MFENFSPDTSLKMDLGGATTGQPSTFGVLEVKQESESECPAELETPPPLKREAEIDITTGPELLMGVEPFVKSELRNDTMKFEDVKPGVQVAISEVFTMRVSSGQTSSRNSDGQPNFKTPTKRITKDNLRLHTNINKGVKLFTCKLCNYRTWKKLNFNVHKTSHLPKKRAYRSRRGFQANNHSAMEKQMQTHGERELHGATQSLKEKTFKCLECDFRASHIDLLHAHKRKHTGGKPFVCLICSYRSRWKQNLKKHMSIHTATLPKKPFDSSRQSSQTNNISAMAEQMEDNLEWKPGMTTRYIKEKRFKCLECDYQANHKDLLHAHQRKHTGEKPFVCQICSYSSSWKGNLKKHMSIHTEDKLFANNHQVNQANNDSCMETHTETPLEKNEQEDVQENSYICEVCDYRTSWKRNVKKHMATHTVGKPSICDICDYQISQEVDPNMGKQYKCNYCEYRVSRKHFLLAHERVHTGEKPFKCSSCGYSTSWRGNLRKHINTRHSEDDVCEYKTNYEPSLTVYKRAPTRDKQFADCNQDKQARYNSPLDEHIPFLTEDKPFACDSCDYKSCWKGNVKLHKKKHHTQPDHLPIEPHLGQPIQPLHEKINQLTAQPHENEDNQASNNSSLGKHTTFHTEDKPFACDLCDYKSRYKCNLKLHKRKHHECPAGTSKHQPCSVCFKSESKVYRFCCESCRWFWNYWKRRASKPMDCPGHETEGETVDCPGCRWGRYKVASLEWEKSHDKIKNTEVLDLDDFELTESTGNIERQDGFQRNIECINGVEPQVEQPIQPLNEEMEQLIAFAHEAKDNEASNNSSLDYHTQFHKEDEQFACDLCDYKSKYKWNLKLHRRKNHIQPVHLLVEPNLDQPIQPLHEELDQLIELANDDKDNQASNNSLLDDHTKFHIEDKPFACDLCDYKSKYKWKVKLHKRKHVIQPVHDKEERLIKSADNNIECAAGTSKHQPCSICFKTEFKVYKFRCESCRWFWNYWTQKASKPPDCPGHETEGEAVDCPGCRWGRYKVASLEWEKSHANIKNTVDDFESTGRMERQGSSKRKVESINGPIEPQSDHPIQTLCEEMDRLIEPAREDNTQFHNENELFACDLCDYKSGYQWNLKLHERKHHNPQQCSVCFKSESKVFKSRCKTCRAFWGYWKRASKPPDCPGHTLEGEDVDCPGCRWGRYKMILLAGASQKTVKNPKQAKDQDLDDFMTPAPDKMGRYGSCQGRINYTKGPIEPSLGQPFQLLQDEMDIKIEPVLEPSHKDATHPGKPANYPICPICFKSEAQVFKFRCEKCRWFWTRMVKGLAEPPECPGHESAGEDADCPGCRRKRYEIAFLDAYPGEPLRVPPMTQPGQEFMDCLTAEYSNAAIEDSKSTKEDSLLNAYPGEPRRVPPLTKPGQELMDFLKTGSSNATSADGD